MATMIDLKKMLAPLAEQSEKISKNKRFEIDVEKVAKALLNEPNELVAKGEGAEEVPDELLKNVIGRVTSIHQLLEKAEEAEDGRIYVTVADDNSLAKEFAVTKGDQTNDTSSSQTNDTEIVDTEKNDDTDEEFDDEPEWPSDLSGEPTRVRKRTSGEEVISTDPSKRKRISTQKRGERQARQDKRDRVLEARAARRVS